MGDSEVNEVGKWKWTVIECCCFAGVSGRGPPVEWGAQPPVQIDGGLLPRRVRTGRSWRLGSSGVFRVQAVKRGWVGEWERERAFYVFRRIEWVWIINGVGIGGGYIIFRWALHSMLRLFFKGYINKDTLGWWWWLMVLLPGLPFKWNDSKMKYRRTCINRWCHVFIW